MKLAVQYSRWYSTPPGNVGSQFTTVLAAEWLGVIGQKWNYERPHVFTHVVLTKTLSARKARDIRVRINFRLDL